MTPPSPSPSPSPDPAGSVPETLTGRVEHRLVAPGSKSEMAAVVLVPEAGDLVDVVLRRRDAVALDAEPELLAYVGRRVRVTGTRAWSAFVVDTVDVIDEPRARLVTDG